MFELEPQEIDHMYFEIFNMDASGLVDYIRSWVKDDQLRIVSSYNGSKVYIEIASTNIHGGEIIFEKWSEWLHYTANYFDVFIDAWQTGKYEGMGITDEEKLKELFVWSVCVEMLIIYEIEKYTTLIEAPFDGDVFVFPYLPIR